MFAYIARVFDKKFGLNSQQIKLTFINHDMATETLQLKIVEETINKEFMNFLIMAIKDSGIAKIDSNLVRYLLLLFVKNASNKELA